MRHFALRALMFIAVATLIFASSTVYGRGPGGGSGGGRAGGRAGGGRGDQGPEFSKMDRKKKDGSKFNAGGLNASNLNGVGLPNTAATKFQGIPGSLKDGKFKGGDFKPQPFQSQHVDAQQKWQSRNGQAQQNIQNSVNDFKNGQQPFSAQWYADHPNAWQSTHPHADAWAVASAAGVAAWLGWGTQPAYYGTSDTVVYQEVPMEEADSNDEVVANQTDAADADSQWLSIGVYSVLTNTGEPTSRYLQLAANHQGELRGVFYDSIASTSQNLSGRIDQSTQIAQWSLDSNPKVTFRAGLNDLTQPTGTIAVNLPAGQQEWRIARQENTN